MTRFYFCYSSALDREALEIWKGQHGYQDLHLKSGELVEIRGFKLVFNFLSRFWGGRVAGLEETGQAKNTVAGILFPIDESLWPAVEHKEGVMTGASVSMTVSVESPLYGTINAIAFT